MRKIFLGHPVNWVNMSQTDPIWEGVLPKDLGLGFPMFNVSHVLLHNGKKRGSGARSGIFEVTIRFVRLKEEKKTAEFRRTLDFLCFTFLMFCNGKKRGSGTRSFF